MGHGLGPWPWIIMIFHFHGGYQECPPPARLINNCVQCQIGMALAQNRRLDISKKEKPRNPNDAISTLHAAFILIG